MTDNRLEKSGLGSENRGQQVVGQAAGSDAEIFVGEPFLAEHLRSEEHTSELQSQR